MKCQTLVKKFEIKNWQKITKYGTPLFFHLKFFYQNDSKWPKMDFEHNF